MSVLVEPGQLSVLVLRVVEPFESLQAHFHHRWYSASWRVIHLPVAVGQYLGFEFNRSDWIVPRVELLVELSAKVDVCEHVRHFADGLVTVLYLELL